MRKMPENSGAYENQNDGHHFSAPKRQFSRQNQHYISHLATYDLETMMNEIQPKYTPYRDREVAIPVAKRVVSRLEPLRNSSENSRNNQFAAAGLRSFNPYAVNPMSAGPERQQKSLNHYGSCPSEKF